jgi:hypothetical protein
MYHSVGRQLEKWVHFVGKTHIYKRNPNVKFNIITNVTEIHILEEI